MSGKIIRLEGTIKELTKSESGNFAFLLVDDQDNIHYCYVVKKKPIGVPSDRVDLIGVRTKSDKIRIEYLKNYSKNETFNLSEKSFNKLYYVALILTLILTGFFIYSLISLIISLGDFISPYNYYGITRFVISMVSFVLSLIGLIFCSVITYLFSKSKKSDDQVEDFIAQIDTQGFEASPQISEPKTNPNGKRYCSSCGESVPTGAKFCPLCGSKI